MDNIICLKCKKGIHPYKRTMINKGKGLEYIDVCGNCTNSFSDKFRKYKKNLEFQLRAYELLLASSA